MWRITQNVSRRVTSLRPVYEPDLLMRMASSNPGAKPPPYPTTDASKQSPQSKDKPVVPPPPPPPPPRRGGGVFFKLLGLTLVGSGGLVAYAWYDEKFKGTIEQNVPYSKEAFDYIFPYFPATAGTAPKPAVTAPMMPPVTQSPPKSLAINPDEAKQISLQKKTEQLPVTPVDNKPTKAEIEAKRKEDVKREKEDVKREKEEKKRREKEEALRKIHERELEDTLENQALEAILELDLSETTNAVKSAIELQISAAATTRDHTSKLREAMDLQGQDKENQWESATAAFAAKSEILAATEAATDFARIEVEKLRSAISEGKANKVTKKNKLINSTEQTLNSLNYDMKTAIQQNAKAQSEARVMVEYRQLVKKGREQFRKEIESITPDVTINKKGGKLSEDELNSLIAHAHRRIEQLQHQLAEQQALEELRIEAALEKQREEDEKLGDSRVQQEREKQKDDLVVIKDRWDLDSRVNTEREIRHQLSRQAAAHSDHLADVLKIQESELKAKFELLLTEHLATERQKFQTEIAGWIARLKGIEAAVEGRAELEQQGRKAQELWLACQMLHNIIENGPDLPTDVDLDDIESYEQLIKPLMDEFMAVLDAGNNHPFVNSILETVPDEAVKRGVWTEKALIDRFDKVRRVCRRVAMVDESGGTLFRYFVSYLQSFFMFSTSKPLTESDKIDISTLSAFTILDNARHNVDHGDLETALRFMNQLSGESRKVAEDWITDARLLLETRQAADALLAHASGNGLGSLF